MDARHGRASQLAALKQGSPDHVERPLRGPGGRRRTLGDEDFRDPDEKARNHIFRMIHTLFAVLRPQDRSAIEGMLKTNGPPFRMGQARRRSLPSPKRLRADRSPFCCAHVLNVRSAHQNSCGLSFGMAQDRMDLFDHSLPLMMMVF